MRDQDPTGVDYYAVDISTLSYPQKTGKLWKTDQNEIIAWIDGSRQPLYTESGPPIPNDWKELVSNLNTRSADHSELNYFLARLHRQGRLDYHSSYFPFQLHLKADGLIQEIGAPEVSSPIDGNEVSLHLESKDLVFLYTPGLVRLKNSQGEEFGLMQLKNLLLQNQKRSAEEIGLTIAQAAWIHHGQITIPSLTLMILKLA